MARRRYQVVGSRAWKGREPGSTFTASLPEGEEQALLEGGHLRRVPKANPKPPAAPTGAKHGTTTN